MFAVSYRDSVEGNLVALSAVTGAIRWAREVWQPAIIGAVPEGLLVTCTVEGSDHRLSVLDPADGAALAQIDVGESFSGPSAIAGADGYLVVRRGEALTGLRLRAGAEDAPPATARLAGAVEICYRRGCSRRARLDVRVTGAEPGAKAETVVTDAGGRFTVPLRRGRLVIASVDRANLRSVEEPLTRDALARDASLPYLAGGYVATATNRRPSWPHATARPSRWSCGSTAASRSGTEGSAPCRKAECCPAAKLLLSGRAHAGAALLPPAVRAPFRCRCGRRDRGDGDPSAR